MRLDISNEALWQIIDVQPSQDQQSITYRWKTLKGALVAHATTITAEQAIEARLAGESLIDIVHKAIMADYLEIMKGKAQESARIALAERSPAGGGFYYLNSEIGAAREIEEARDRMTRRELPSPPLSQPSEFGAKIKRALEGSWIDEDRPARAPALGFKAGDVVEVDRKEDENHGRDGVIRDVFPDRFVAEPRADGSHHSRPIPYDVQFEDGVKHFGEMDLRHPTAADGSTRPRWVDPKSLPPIPTGLATESVVKAVAAMIYEHPYHIHPKNFDPRSH